MTVLVIAEHASGSIKPSTYSCVTAASLLSSDVVVLVAGYSVSAQAQAAAAIHGVTRVIAMDDASLANELPEILAPSIAVVASGFTHILAPATAFGKNLLPRLAGLLDVQPISDVIDIISPDTFKRPVYAGNALAIVQSTDKIKLLTVRGTAFAPAAASGGVATVDALAAQPAASALSQFVSAELTQSARPELTAAKIVVSGGRGVGSAENFALVEALADKLGAAVGASRAAVDAGYAPNDYQVGQTGKVVAPQLYIAVGISGAIQHLAGMKDSKVIVAINKDPDAPIFQVADYGLVADLFEVVPSLTEKL